MVHCHQDEEGDHEWFWRRRKSAPGTRRCHLPMSAGRTAMQQFAWQFDCYFTL
jgi:hypothetical protein